jgi:glutamate 5-kinase
MNRVVIKIGSRVLTEDGEICFRRLRALVDLIAEIHITHEVILVSSGAVASGHTRLPNLDNRTTANKQALSAIGQAMMINRYQQQFDDYNITVAQILLAQDDLNSLSHSHNAKQAIETLLQNNVIPIINENDTIVTDELLRGDNDVLAANVTNFVSADELVILSDIDGYYDLNPKEHSNATILKVVHHLSDEELNAEMTPGDKFATGGIVTKLKAAEILLKSNKTMFLASGFDLKGIRNYFFDIDNAIGTLFVNKDVL